MITTTSLLLVECIFFKRRRMVDEWAFHPEYLRTNVGAVINNDKWNDFRVSSTL